MEKFTEPMLLKAGDSRLLLGHGLKPPKVDCRVIEESNYQLLKSAYNREQLLKPSEKPYDIMDKLEDLQDECYKRNKGSNEAELEFREEVANWIQRLEQGKENCPKCGKLMTKLIPHPYCCPDINCGTRK